MRSPRSHLTFFYQISSLSKSCYSHIRELHCVRPHLDSKTASTIADSIVHSKLDYWLLQLYIGLIGYNLPESQINGLQQIQNSLVRIVVKAPIFQSHPYSDLCTDSRLMNALNINSPHSPTKFSLPANLTTFSSQSFSVQSTCRTRSSSAVTLARPFVSPRLNHQPLF